MDILEKKEVHFVKTSFLRISTAYDFAITRYSASFKAPLEISTFGLHKTPIKLLCQCALLPSWNPVRPSQARREQAAKSNGDAANGQDKEGAGSDSAGRPKKKNNFKSFEYSK